MNTLFRTILPHFIALLAVSAVHVGAADARRPNILILIADDLGYADIGVQGCSDVATPNIDSIAKSGVRFTSGYVSAPVCSPSRAGLLTGRYQTRFGHEFNHPLADRAPVGLPVAEKLAAQWFKDAAYATGHIGKWHLGNPKMPQFHPNARGFEESVWFPGQKKIQPLQCYRNGTREKVDDRYVDEAMAREAGAFLEKHKQEPWFLYVGFLTPHQPLETPPGAEDAFKQIEYVNRRKCAAMLKLLDGSVGIILKALHDTGQDQRTLIVFLSDNGAPPKNGSLNTPLSGGKGTTWDGGIREPFVLSFKGVLPEGRVIDAPVISLDLLPTALAAAGIAVSASAKLDGANLLPFLTGKTQDPPHSALFWRYGEQWAIRAGDWKLMRAMSLGEAKTLLPSPHLYNIAADPSEKQDLADAHPERVKALQKQWDDWNRANIPALWDSESDNAPEDVDSHPGGKTGPTKAK